MMHILQVVWFGLMSVLFIVNAVLFKLHGHGFLVSVSLILAFTSLILFVIAMYLLFRHLKKLSSGDEHGYR